MNLVIAICFQVLDHDSLAFQMQPCIIFSLQCYLCSGMLLLQLLVLLFFSVLSVVVNLINKHLSTYCVSGTVLDSGHTEMN